MSKLFSVLYELGQKCITFAGIKTKNKPAPEAKQEYASKADFEALKKRLVTNEMGIKLLRNGRHFIWANFDRMTTAQKVRYLSRRFYQNAGYYPNFKRPRSFNEKLCWLKFNYDDPVENICSSKYEFKSWIKQRLGDGYTVPMIGVYDDLNDIDFDKLPEKFVIKTTSGWGGYGTLVVRDKSKLDIDRLKFDFAEYMQEWNNLYYAALTSSYKNVKHRVIIEEYVEELEKSDCDFKFFCFHGKVKCFYVANNFAVNKTHNTQTLTYYDLDGNPLPFNYGDYKNSDKKLENVENLQKMIEIAESIAQDFPFVRIDFYNLKDKLMLSEMTFRPGGGWGKYTPREWDYKLGEYLDLSKLNPDLVKVLPEFQLESGE
ncbi:MAG: hypothetical protein E7050_10290 [Lentisphaerae bacterium]|nr:hypothetical protein [Lentisphaerota bacterium]